MPDGRFNLFAMGRFMKDGWTLTGSSDAIGLKEGNSKVVFDIPIDTGEGHIYAGMLRRDKIGTDG